MKIAIVHDHLCGKGGSERIFQYICEAFPEADAYTLAFNAKTTFPYFATRPLQTTWLQPFIRSARAFRWLFVLGTYAMRSLDFSKYDLVISSSTTTAKYLKAPRGRHLCYCYMPTRALWHFESYFGQSKTAFFLRPLLPALKKRDFLAAQQVDRFFTISESSKNYIRQYYHREAEVIYCPIDVSQFTFKAEKKEHYLIVSRLEHWKRVDYAIEAFNQLGLPLKVIGAGAQREKLQAMAKSNIAFLGEVDDQTLAQEYSECKAVIFTPFLEYGLIPLEANASGTPVIAYGKGGIRETMIPGQTALFFEEQTADSLIACIRQAERFSLDPYALREHALKWDRGPFVKDFRAKMLEAAGALLHTPALR
jgi:glycosyltransferase involved in cell wall biosynthesis